MDVSRRVALRQREEPPAGTHFDVDEQAVTGCDAMSVWVRSVQGEGDDLPVRGKMGDRPRLRDEDAPVFDGEAGGDDVPELDPLRDLPV